MRGRPVDRILDVGVTHHEASVLDLVGVLDSARGSGSGPERTPPITVAVDGRDVEMDTLLSSVPLCEGSVVETGPRCLPPTPTARALAVVGGVRAGEAHPVPLGAVATVGRSRQAEIVLDDPTVSARHLTLTGAAVCDLGSRNGTSIEGHRVSAEPAALRTGDIVRLGASRLKLCERVVDPPVAFTSALGSTGNIGGTVVFNRPPRRSPDLDPPTVAAPGPPPDPPEPEPLSWAGLVLPVAAGAVVAWLFSPLFAMFAALGPILTLGTWWEHRRRARRGHRGALVDHDRSLENLQTRLEQARRAEIDRLRACHPDPAEVVRRALGLSVRCWERRGTDPDAFVLAVGAGDTVFGPDLVGPDGGSAGDEAHRRLGGIAPMPDVPMPVDLRPGEVVGLVGDRSTAVAVARCLVLELAVHHGPADLALVVGADEPAEWSWCRWLPHTTDSLRSRRGAGVVATGDVAVVDELVEAAGGRALVALLDGADPFRGRVTVGRRLLVGGAAAVVIVDDGHRLPSGCTTLVRVDGLGRIEVADPRRATAPERGLGWGMDADLAEAAARRLARLDDPELPLAGADLPSAASVLTMLGVSGDDPDEIEARWRAGRRGSDLVVPIGADGGGPVMIDLVVDGPHVLIGGTTGSGKSELLRSFVAAAAATADPSHLAMVLIDYKGGAAFDCCAELPHVVGVVTDLDDDLAARALRCLEAELRHRERRLREAGADDLASFRRARGDRQEGSLADPLPRLLVVVDEFASLVADLPDFVTSLVGIAQRGRSLGVHLVLATQRPAGVVTDDIRANAGCRICLRVTDRHDSSDVIDEPDAAAIPRDRPGRAYARFGPGELVAFQAAYGGGHTDDRARVHLAGPGPSVSGRAGPTDLERLVAAIRMAHDRTGAPPPRSPWLPPLPTAVAVDELGAPGWLLLDDPDGQCRRVGAWENDDGHLMVIAGPKAGATTTLAAAVLHVTGPGGATAPHVHVIDLDSGALGALGALAHVGTVALPSDRERRVRLLRWLDEEVARRRHGATGEPPVVLVVDDFGGLARAHDPVRERRVHEQLERIWLEGPAVGVTVAVSVRRAADLPAGLAATVGTALIHRSTDPADAMWMGVTDPTTALADGRVIRAGDGLRAQVARWAPTIAGAVAGLPPVEVPPVRPHEVGVLGAVIDATDVGVDVVVGAHASRLRVAIRDRDLALCELVLRAGDHAVVVGPSRSGRTTTLETIARTATGPVLVVESGRVSVGDLASRLGIDPVKPHDLQARIGTGPALVLVDDALDVADPDGVLADLVGAPPLGVHVVATARPGPYRSAYGHWSSALRNGGSGLLLRPEPMDGDLFGVTLPAQLQVPALPGRGVMVADGTVEIVQVARTGEEGTPPSDHSEG